MPFIYELNMSYKIKLRDIYITKKSNYPFYVKKKKTVCHQVIGVVLEAVISSVRIIVNLKSDKYHYYKNTSVHNCFST